MKTTDEIMREMDEVFVLEQSERLRAHEARKAFVRNVCDAGLVDDVAPSGRAEPVVITCSGCGRDVPGDGLECPTCPMGTPFTIRGHR